MFGYGRLLIINYLLVLGMYFTQILRRRSFEKSDKFTLHSFIYVFAVAPSTTCKEYVVNSKDNYGNKQLCNNLLIST